MPFINQQHILISMRAVAAAAIVGDKIETHCGFGKFIIFWENEGLAHNIRRNG